jgi:hypothetical protein
MGIKYLNRYMKTQCKSGISTKPLWKFRNKTLVFDTSIYLYRFLEENKLLENFFCMVSQCHKNQITPIFVFDGKPTDAKSEVLMERYYRRKAASLEYQEYQQLLESEQSDSMTVEERIVLEAKMEMCKKESTKVTGKHIQDVRNLLESMEVCCLDALEEADVLCAYLVKRKIAWACVSDDMDMFVYGCQRVLREWNVEKEEVQLYDRNVIIKQLNVQDSESFSAILILLGTDYQQLLGKNTRPMGVQYAFHTYHVYLKQQKKSMTKYGGRNRNQQYQDTDQRKWAYDFYQWLAKTNKIEASNVIPLYKIYEMFQIPKVIDLPKAIAIPDHMSTILPGENFHWEKIKELLKPLGFII